MKKKISVFALLLFFLFQVLAPVPVKAEEVDVDKLCVEACEALLNDSSMVDILSSGRQYAIGYSDYTGYVTMLLADDGSPGVCIKTWSFKVFVCDNLSGKNNTSATEYQYIDGVWQSGSSGAVSIRNNSTCPVIVASNYDTLYDTSSNVVQSNIPSIFEYIKGYSFVDWCDDTELNCYASSNESASVIPYSYNDYWHIVRKTSSGNWLLTTICSTIGQAKMNLRLSEDLGSMQLYEFSGDDSFVISVREYEYDSDGWKLRTYSTYDYDDFSGGLLTLPAGSGIDDTRILAYTSTDIYSSDGLSIYAAASTEYVEPSVPDVTPEPTPGSGSSGSGDSDDSGFDDSGSSGGGRPGSGTRPSVGGEASGGGGLDFIINLFTLIWTKICAVPMAVDGYSISLQQLFVYGALVSIVGGFIIKFIFRR